MTSSKKETTTKIEDRRQVAAFRKAAREAGCDNNEERFQKALLAVAKAKPKSPKLKK